MRDPSLHIWHAAGISTLIQRSRKLRPFYGGSHIMFQLLMSGVLVPLHQRIGIIAVRMGGYVDRRV